MLGAAGVSHWRNCGTVTVEGPTRELRTYGSGAGRLEARHAVEEATKWKEEASQLTEELEVVRGDAERYKEEHAQILQEIDEISMEQIDVEEELNTRIRELEGLLRQNGIDVPDAPGGDDA